MFGINPLMMHKGGIVYAPGDTWSPSMKGAGVVLGESNLIASGSGRVRSSGSRSNPTRQFEVTLISDTGSNAIGVSAESWQGSLTDDPGGYAAVAYYDHGAIRTYSGDSTGVPTWTAGDVIGCAITGGTVRFYKNGTLAWSSTVSMDVSIMIHGLVGGSMRLNAGGPFIYSMSGYAPWGTS